MLPDWTKRLLAGAAVIPVVFGTVSASPLATAETQDTRASPVAASNQDTADHADTTNNGEDLTRPAPTLNIDLRGRWFLTFYPSYDIRINFGAPNAGQTGRLFLPFDALLGAKLTDNLQISLEVGVPLIKEYPVYNFKTEARVLVSF